MISDRLKASRSFAEIAVACIGCALIAAAAVLGAAIVLLTRKVTRFLPREPLYLFTIPLAVVLAVGASELVLRRGRLRAPEAFSRGSEPRSHLDARLGWLFDVSRTGSV